MCDEAAADGDDTAAAADDPEVAAEEEAAVAEPATGAPPRPRRHLHAEAPERASRPPRAVEAEADDPQPPVEAALESARQSPV